MFRKMTLNVFRYCVFLIEFILLSMFTVDPCCTQYRETGEEEI